MAKIDWFRLNRHLHRDIGYLLIGLTIVFAVSGIALNHLDDWNSNYVVERVEKPIPFTKVQDEASLTRELLSLFAIEQPIKASYWESDDQLKLFFAQGANLSANFASKTAVFENVSVRPVFKQFNTLHLNEVKAGWVIFSDLYAALLLFLAISALFMIKGKNSVWRWRKGWLVVTGFTIPLFYMLL